MSIIMERLIIKLWRIIGTWTICGLILRNSVWIYSKKKYEVSFKLKKSYNRFKEHERVQIPWAVIKIFGFKS